MPIACLYESDHADVVAADKKEEQRTGFKEKPKDSAWGTAVS